MSIYSIYMITNKINGKSYIGFDSNYPKRIFEHFRESQKTKRNTKFYNAIRKYGWDNFDHCVLYQSKDLNHTLNEMENFFICEFDTFHNGYNSTTGGERGFSFLPEVKKKLSLAAKANPLSEESRKKISEKLKNVPKSYEQKLKTSNTLKGHSVSETTREKISKSLIGKKYKKRTEEHSRKLAIARTGKKLSEELKKKISEKTKEAMARRKLLMITQESQS